MADADMTATTAEESVGGGVTKKDEAGKEEQILIMGSAIIVERSINCLERKKHKSVKINKL